MTTYVANTCDCSGQDLVVTRNVSTCKNGRSKESEEIRQKRMWSQVRAPASVYTMNLASINVASHNDNLNTVAVKHNSYDRYLAKKKANNLLTSKPSSITPLYGNKNKKYGMLSSVTMTNCSTICN